MNRGYLATSLAGLMGFAVLSLVGILLLNSGQQERTERVRLQRLQGREWCLGLLQQRQPVDLHLGHWHLERTADGRVRATGPVGTYAIGQDHRERWLLAQAVRP